MACGALIARPRSGQASTCCSRQLQGCGSRMPARPSREGQGSKRSWLPADNPAWAGTAASSAGFPCRSPAEKTRAQPGDSPSGAPARPPPPQQQWRHWVLRCCRGCGPTGMQVVGRPADSTAQSCFDTSRKHRRPGNINLQALWGPNRMRHPLGLPGSNSAPSKMGGAETGQLESGKGSAVGWGGHRAPQM